MGVVIDKLSGAKVKLTIEVSKEYFDKGLDYSFEKNVQGVEVKGFRKGKIPRGMFEKKFGVEVLFEEAVNFCISESYGDVIEENKIEVVAMPKIDVDFPKIEAGKGFKYTAEVAVTPTVELGNYKGLGIKQDAVKVEEKDITAQIEGLLKSKVVTVEKEGDTLENGDISIIDYKGFNKDVQFEGGTAENHELTIGSGQFIPGFEEKMIGMKKGETKDVNLTFPKEYHNEELAGADVKFVVTLHDIKVKQIPELTKELIAELKIEGVTTEAELKEDIKAKVLKSKEEQAENIFVEAIMNKIADNSKIEFSDEQVDAETNKMLDNVSQQAKQYNMTLEMFAAVAMQGKSLEDLKKEMNVQSEKKVKYAAIIDAVSVAEKIEASEKAVNAKFEEYSKMYNMSVEQIKTMVPTEALNKEIAYEETVKFLMKNQ